MPKSFFGLADLLNRFWAEMTNSDRDLTAAMLCHWLNAVLFRVTLHLPKPCLLR
jgi:hypothetical protein